MGRKLKKTKKIRKRTKRNKQRGGMTTEDGEYLGGWLTQLVGTSASVYGVIIFIGACVGSNPIGLVAGAGLLLIGGVCWWAGSKLKKHANKKSYLKDRYKQWMKKDSEVGVMFKKRNEILKFRDDYKLQKDRDGNLIPEPIDWKFGKIIGKPKLMEDNERPLSVPGVSSNWGETTLLPQPIGYWLPIRFDDDTLNKNIVIKLQKNYMSLTRQSNPPVRGRYINIEVVDEKTRVEGVIKLVEDHIQKEKDEKEKRKREMKQLERELETDIMNRQAELQKGSAEPSEEEIKRMEKLALSAKSINGLNDLLNKRSIDRRIYGIYLKKLIAEMPADEYFRKWLWKGIPEDIIKNHQTEEQFNNILNKFSDYTKGELPTPDQQQSYMHGGASKQSPVRVEDTLAAADETLARLKEFSRGITTAEFF